MPHIIVENSDNLDLAIKESNLLKLLHQAVVDFGIFSPDSVKARANSYENYILPDGANSFIHITVSILDGRDKLVKRELSAKIFEITKASITQADKVSVDINEMNTASYQK